MSEENDTPEPVAGGPQISGDEFRMAQGSGGVLGERGLAGGVQAVARRTEGSAVSRQHPRGSRALG